VWGTNPDDLLRDCRHELLPPQTIACDQSIFLLGTGPGAPGKLGGGWPAWRRGAGGPIWMHSQLVRVSPLVKGVLGCSLTGGLTGRAWRAGRPAGASRVQGSDHAGNQHSSTCTPRDAATGGDRARWGTPALRTFPPRAPLTAGHWLLARRVEAGGCPGAGAAAAAALPPHRWARIAHAAASLPCLHNAAVERGQGCTLAGQPHAYLLADNTLQELNQYKHKYSSWLVGQTVMSGGGRARARPCKPCHARDASVSPSTAMR